MGAIRSSAIALLSTGAAGAVLAFGVFAAPSAPAAEPAQVTSFGFAVTPSTVAPGGQVTLSVTNCDAAYATASSGVFDTVSIARGQTVRVTVDRDARRGALYSVTFTCNGENGSADLTIAGGTTSPSTSSTTGIRPSPSTGTTAGIQPRATPTTRTTPATRTTPTTRSSAGATLGVRGGLGGSVAGMDPLELGAGAALFLAAAGGTAYALRRRRQARGH
ncbi:hypothetical protein [Streptomyces sp. NBC_00091]|uniref:hypothetical protein n=1 Tax=Streptomyces sp. NBC_00091 TaxID=2975648 RepID=UPI00224C8FF1|nr:hypothetical protein [Streptomyces sp. NBC_00091]MCX5380224.1 hypothetical protein [Streptomyces sp. NBC_00091]MCX5380909.1 hypothetical protein [Streptomyces sp. NBC_00091]